MKRLYTYASSLISAIMLPLVPLWAATVDNPPPPGVDITIQSLFGIVRGLACWASRFAIIAMVVMIIWYGIQFLIAQGDPSKFTKAKTSINYAIIGIIVILGAYTIIATVGNTISSANSSANTDTSWLDYMPLDCSGY